MRASGLLVLLFAASASFAHNRSESYSHWYPGGTEIIGTVTIPLREAMLLYQVESSTVPPTDLFRAHLVANTAVSGASGACRNVAATNLNAASGFVRVELQYDCGSSPPSDIRYRALFDAAPAHVHYAKLHVNGMQVAETLLTDQADAWHIANLGDGGNHSFLSFLRLGIEHIAGGIDHIAFLAGMLLVAGSFKRSVIAVTGFTLGHSVSLVSAVLGYVHADGSLVEAFIGFTVALVAVEYFALKRTSAVMLGVVCLASAWTVGLLALPFADLPARAFFVYGGFGLFAFCYLLASRSLARASQSRATSLLFIATACFGLVHGFGFAGFLMETGILGGSLFVPLLGFNLGVEIGQLLLVAAALLFVRLARDRLPPRLPAAIAAGLCSVGVYWFVGRTFLV